MIRRVAALLLGSALACTADAAIVGAPSPAVPEALDSPGSPEASAPEPATRPAGGAPPAAQGADAAAPGDSPGSQTPTGAPREAGPSPLEAEASPLEAGPSAVEAEASADEAGCVDSLAALPDDGLRMADDPRRPGGALIVVRKAARRLMLFEDGARTLCMRVGLGFAPEGHKRIQGDGRTPEGWYRTSDKPWSSFDHAIAIHYPNEDDARAAASDGRIKARTRDRIVADVRSGRVPPQSTKLGGAVLIHGGGASADWTLGCIALEDEELLALRRRLPRGVRADLLVLP